MTYRREIDGLRALAVLAVVLFHAGVPGCAGGFVGVDVFFVISGFLITCILDSESDSQVSYGEFYERRARRILPALFAVLVASLLPAWALLTPSQLDRFFGSFAAIAGFSSNVVFWRQAGYFGPAAEEEPLLHTWSLAVEEQYYLVFPLAFALLRKGGRRVVWAGLISAWLCSFALCEWGSRAYPSATFYLAPTRAWEILTGAMCAVAARSARQLVATPLSTVASFCGVAMIVGSISFLDEDARFPSVAALPATMGTALVIQFARAGCPATRTLGYPPLVGLGLISYSTYLWHQPVFAFARAWTLREPPLSAFLTLSVLSVALGYLSWRFIERPFRDRKFLKRRQVLALGALGSCLLFSLGTCGAILEPTPARFSDEEMRLIASIRSSPKRDACHTAGTNYRPPARACRYFTGEPKWAVMGDSHMVEVAYELARLLETQGRDGVLHLTFSGCPPALSFQAKRQGCTQWTREAVALLEGRAEIEHVVLGYRHSGHLYGENLSAKGDPNAEEPNMVEVGTPSELRERYWKSFTEMIERLVSAGKVVYLMDPVPELGVDIQKAIGFSVEGEPKQMISLVDYRTRNDFILQKIDSLAFGPRLRRIVTAEIFCQGVAMHCETAREHPLYFDDHHLSLAGARLVAEEIVTLATPGEPRL